MPNQILDRKLLSKLAKKLGKSEKYIGEQVSKRAARESMFPAAYFVCWLNKEKIPCSVYLRRLPEPVQNQIRERLLREKSNGSQRVTPGASTNGASRVPTKKGYGIDITPCAPLIDPGLIKSAQANAEIYPFLFVFENSIRRFISSVLGKKYGENWWTSSSTSGVPLVKKEIKDKVEDRKNDEGINRFHGGRGSHEIFYTDFSELASILKNNAGDFNKYFQGVKGKLGFLTQKLDELAISRNAVAHMGSLTKKDRGRLLLYTEDWRGMLDGIVARL